MIKTDVKPKVLVIGDLMIDAYLIGSCDRIALDAPVPVLDIKEEIDVLGGAGNVVRNLASLGAKVSVMSVTGDGQNGKELKHLLDQLEAKSFILEQKEEKLLEKQELCQMVNKFSDLIMKVKTISLLIMLKNFIQNFKKKSKHMTQFY